MNRRHTRQTSPRLLSALVVVLALAALLTACAAPVAPSGSQTAATEAPATEAPATEAPAATEAPTEAPAATEAPTEAPAATEAPTEAPAATEAPATEAPAATEAPTEAAATTGGTAVSFSTDVMPIFEQTCLKCHGGEETRGELDLRTHEALMKGGKDGVVVVPGDAANSMLVKLIEEGKMPRRAPKLPQEQIDLIAQWVNEGAQNN